MLKKGIALLLSVCMFAGVMTGCEKKEVTLDNVEIANFTEPQIGEEIVVMTIKDYGEIKIKLFPELCPKGVENFVGLIEKGYYDEVIFHRVIKDFMIQGGDPKGDGTGGESLWGEGFTQEINPQLCHFAGALSYGTASDKLNKSQFFIVTGDEKNDLSDEEWDARWNSKFESLSQENSMYFSENVIAKYKEVSGYPSLDGNYEVFGQVFEGLDIVFEISKVETGEHAKPVEQVLIEKVEVVQYEG